MHQRLGQHFLINKSAIAETIAALTLEENDLVVEIGPGHGALTLPLAQKCVGFNCKIMAIEKDAALVDNLSETMRKYGNMVQIIAGDALEELPKLAKRESLGDEDGKGWKLVGNIPYYITGKLLRIIGELENKPHITVLMVQKEVAERITATPKGGMNPVRSSPPIGPSGALRAGATSNGMNLLAAATQFWSDISIIKRLKPSDFDPPPEVDSAIIKLKIKDQRSKRREAEGYYKLIKIAFKQPRKTLLNNLVDGLDDKKEVILQKIADLGFNEKTRGQELSVEQLLVLARSFG